MERLSLRLHPEKTRIVELGLCKQGFVFLGCYLRVVLSHFNRREYLFRWPAPKAIMPRRHLFVPCLLAALAGCGESPSPSAGDPVQLDFTIVVLPDTQFYTSGQNGGSPVIFNAQTQWIVDNLVAKNIVYVAHVGDVTNNGDNNGDPIEWTAADAAMKRLEDPTATHLAEGLPYAVAVGNRDQSPAGSVEGTTALFNQYFGEKRFAGRTYYGGHYGSSNNNSYSFFSASGMAFIVVYLEYSAAPDAAVLAWADSILQAHGNRRAIVVSHYIINSDLNASFSPQGQAIYDTLKLNPNLFLMVSGHLTEGRRNDTFGGRTVWSLMSGYQSRPAGGNGWLRTMEFSPAHNVIRVRTYSPWLDKSESDADSEFDIPYDMTGNPLP